MYKIEVNEEERELLRLITSYYADELGALSWNYKKQIQSLGDKVMRAKSKKTKPRAYIRPQKEDECKWCGKPFSGDVNKKYCSDECADHAARFNRKASYVLGGKE